MEERRHSPDKPSPNTKKCSSSQNGSWDQVPWKLDAEAMLCRSAKDCPNKNAGRTDQRTDGAVYDDEGYVSVERLNLKLCRLSIHFADLGRADTLSDWVTSRVLAVSYEAKMAMQIATRIATRGTRKMRQPTTRSPVLPVIPSLPS
jgi:hypothetical protein